jgi:glycosyltransferase involved in cell wall biosynthesis
VRILVFHGYLLRGTGSNVYTAELARALVGLGHQVHLLCQDREAAGLEWVDAVGTWNDAVLQVEPRREPVRCTVYRPEIGRILPVYVPDRYEGFEARPFAELSDRELTGYLDANIAALRDVAARVRPDVALANHAVMGPVILARGLAGVPYAVKIHGSALEYTVRPEPGRFVPYAREGLDGAGGVLVGSRHTAESLWEVLGADGLREKTRLGPPGVDTGRFRPRSHEEGRDGLARLAVRLQDATASWGSDAGAAPALADLAAGSGPIVSYVGKLLVAKGVDLLLAAWPLVVQEVPEARLCVVGFGGFRAGIEKLLWALAAGDLRAARDVAENGRALEGGGAGRLTHLASFLDGLAGEARARYVAAAPGAAARVWMTGRLEHADLPDLLGACTAQVVPSTFPEAFGMVAAEAAACGALPVSAAHSGLAEVTSTLAGSLDPELRPLLSFPLGPAAVEDIADRLVRWLRLEPATRAGARGALSALARERYGWAGVARGVVAAAEGRLHDLSPAAPG